jgi:hypothetical protein
LSRFPDEFVADSHKEAAVAPGASPGIVAEEAIEIPFEKAFALGTLDSFILAFWTLHEKIPFRLRIPV